MKQYIRKVAVFNTPEIYSLNERIDYAPSLADALGLNWIVADLDFRADRESLPDDIENALKTHLKADGYRYCIRGGGSASKSLRQFAYDKTSMNRVLAIFPKEEDMVRIGAFHTPCYGGIAPLPISIEVVKDQDMGLYGGDGCAAVHPGVLKAWFGDDKPKAAQMQIRAVSEALRVQIKGTLVLDKDAPKGVLRLPSSMVKGDGAAFLKQVGSEGAPDLLFGIVSYAEMRPMRVSYQITQTWSKNVWDVQRKARPKMLKDMRALVANPELLISLPKKDDPYSKSLWLFKELAREMGNRQPLLMRGIVDDLANSLSSKAIDMINGMGGKVWSFMAIESQVTPAGEMWLNPDDHKRVYATPDNRSIVGRMPATPSLVSGIPMLDAFKGKVLPKQECPRGSIMFKASDAAIMAADSDGDYLLVIPRATNEWTEVWYDEFTPAKAESKVRAKVLGQTNLTVAQKVRQMAVNVGTPANAISDILSMIEQKPSYAIQLSHMLCAAKTALQQSVDAAKQNVSPDMSFMRVLKMMKTTIAEPDNSWREFASGRIKAFVKAPDNLGPYKQGEVIVPSKAVKGTTQLAQAWREMGDEMPLIALDWLPNSHYRNWLPEPNPASEGAKWATSEWEQFKKALQLASKLDEDEQQEAISDAMKAYHKANLEYAEDAFAQDRVEAALWQWQRSFAHPLSRQFCMRYGQIDEIGVLIRANMDKIKKLSKRKEQAGTIIGKSYGDHMQFADMMEGKPERVFEVIPEKGKDAKRIKLTFPNGKTWITDENTSVTARGKFKIVVRPTPHAGRWQFVSVHESVGDEDYGGAFMDELMSDLADLAKSLEGESAPDYEFDWNLV